ncbi:MAG: hypothetical protein P4L46_02705 [Fimbriimonas sp.]|nr:hypothetical protein [Fimbriimonas sp.]
MICDGRNVYSVSFVGTPDEGYDKSSIGNKNSGIASIDAFLGRDIVDAAEQYLSSSTLTLKKAHFVVGFGDSVKRNGVSFKVVVIRQVKPEASIKLYIAPSGLLEGEEARLQTLYVHDDGNGNRKQSMAPETYSALLGNVDLGKPIADDMFTYDEATHRSLRQPETLSSGMEAPDFSGTNLLTGQHIRLDDILKTS